QQAAQLANILAVQEKFVMAGKTHIVNDMNLYNSAKRLQETAGFKKEGEFFTPPDVKNPPPPASPNPEVMKTEMEARLEQERLASDERKKAAEIQSAEVIARMQSETSLAVAQIKSATDQAIAKMKEEFASNLEIFRAGHESQMLEKKGEVDSKLEQVRAENKPPVLAQKKKGEQQEPVIKALDSLVKATHELIASTTGPKEVVRDKDGNIVGVRPARLQ